MHGRFAAADWLFLLNDDAARQRKPREARANVLDTYTLRFNATVYQEPFLERPSTNRMNVMTDAPDPMPSLQCRLVVADARAAMAFYESAFGAEVHDVHQWGDRVVSASLDLFGTTMTLKDEDETDPSPTTLGRPGVLLDVSTHDPDALAAQALGVGACTVFEVADQDYGSRAGRVRDPFGHEWIIGTPVRSEPTENRHDLGSGQD